MLIVVRMQWRSEKSGLHQDFETNAADQFQQDLCPLQLGQWCVERAVFPVLFTSGRLSEAGRVLHPLLSDWYSYLEKQDMESCF